MRPTAADLSIPRSGGAITVEWIQSALAAGVHPPRQDLKSVRIEEIGVGSGILGQVLRCHLQWDSDQGGWHERQPMSREADRTTPETLIVKLPSEKAKNRRLSKRLALYRREYEFYRRLGTRVPLRTPGVYHAQFERRSHRFALVLEDLGGMEVVDQVAGATPVQARRAIRALARMHGAFWNRTHEPPLATVYDSTNPRLRPVVQAVYLASLVRTLAHFGDLFSSTTRQLAEAFGMHLTDVAATLAACPQTFTHGDYRLDNLFFAQDGCDDVVAIDWQNSGRNCGLFDLAYFLIGNLTVPVRRQIEREIVEEYHDALLDAGTRDFSRDECWRLYRLNSLGPLLTNVIACGGLDRVGGRSRKLIEIGLTRSLAAIEDMEVAEYFPRRRGAAYHASRLAYRAYRARLNATAR
ncbi:MAG: phosphotransferase [Gammaproteobacteria bacterium]|nr:phosphotransferase [Gammaproteobacteria bacterium]